MAEKEDKAALRKAYLVRRAAISRADRARAAQMAASILFDVRALNLLPRFYTFAAYLSVGAEFPTEAVLQALFQAQAAVCVPRFSDVQRGYAWASLAPGVPMRQGPHRIPEPETSERFPAGYVDAVLVPGVAFDICGGRLGYGAGIYDRLLAGLRQNSLRVGMAFDCQVRREPLPQELHDEQMDYLVTETQWIDCRLARSLKRRRGHG